MDRDLYSETHHATYFATKVGAPSLMQLADTVRAQVMLDHLHGGQDAQEHHTLAHSLWSELAAACC